MTSVSFGGLRGGPHLKILRSEFPSTVVVIDAVFSVAPVAVYVATGVSVASFGTKNLGNLTVMFICPVDPAGTVPSL